MSATAVVFGLLAIAGPGELPEVRYVAKAVTRSWEPIAIREVERMVEQAAREPLTKGGHLKLVKAAPAELSQGAYTLRISGRFVEEAERLTVYLSFGPGTREDLPSLFAADTTGPLGRKKRAEMERRIRATAKRAAERLAAALDPWLARTQIDVSPPLVQPSLPMNWGDIDVPPVRDKSKAIRTLLDPRQPDGARAEALRELEGHIFDQQPARNAAERCVLRDPSPKIRKACVEALAPTARAHVPTQRILLHAMRTDVDEQVLSALAKVSKGFVGLSRMETVATWLHMVSSDATPARAAEKVARLLAKEKSVPNLEFAVAACLQQDSVVYGKRNACASQLLKRIPGARRPSVVRHYLERAAVFGSGERLTYEAVLNAVMEDRKAPPTPAMAALMLDLAERPATGRLRYKAIYLAGRHAPADAETVSRLLKLAHEPRLASGAIKSAVEVAQRNPALASATLAALDALSAEAKWYPRPHRANPRDDLKKARKRLERLKEKGK